MSGEQRIGELHVAPGELSFEARIGGTARRVSFRTETPLTPSADAALAGAPSGWRSSTTAAASAASSGSR